MNLTSPSQVKAWCIENGFHPNKVLGQNFLIDRNALVSIVEAGLDIADKSVRVPKVLEIGPGLGVLTEEMLNRGVHVTAIEKDPVLAERLKASLGNPAGLEVISGDALDILHLSTSTWLNQIDCMVSNLPYQAGTRILLDLVQQHTLPKMTVLVQTEVAERLAAKEGGKTRGLAGVWAQLDYDVKIVRKVAASCFWPRPEIGSSVVTLTKRAAVKGLTALPDLTPEERKMFYRITKQAFEHRRKQLGSIFKGVIDSTMRAEELTNDEWVALAKGLVQNADA